MAGALSRRDIEMIFRAETDKATRPIGDLTKDVRGLRAALKDQIEMADKGEVSLDRLAATTRDLKQAQEELGTARSLLTSLNAQVAALEKAEAKVEETGKKYYQLQAQVEAAEKPTKRLTSSMEAAGRAYQAAQDQLARVNNEANETRERITAIIGPVDNFQEAFREIADTSKEIARGLAVAGEAADSFKAKIAAANQAAARGDADNAFQQQGRDAGLLQAQIDYISQFENRVELLNQAKRELTQQNAAFDEALRAQAAREGAENVRRITATIQEAAAEEQRLAAVNGFRDLATQANAAATDVARFEPAAESAAGSAVRLAAAISSINDPMRDAFSTVGGLEDAVRRADAVLQSGSKNVSDYARAQGELAVAQRAAVEQASQIDGYRAQEAALAASTARFQAAQHEVQQLAAAMPATEQEAADLAKQLKTAEGALETAGRAMQKDATILRDMGQALDKAGIDVRELATAEERLTKVAREAAAAQGELGKKTGRGGGTNAFGFSLQDMQNLSYQVNDLITQVASGTPITQAFAQQFGQIYQIPAINAMIARFAAWIPLIAAAAAVAATLAAAISRVGDKAEALRAAEGYTASLGQQGSLTAQQIADASIKMQDFGVSAEDAMKAARAFNEGGLDPQYLNSFIDAAKNASAVTGVEFSDAFATLTAAMNGGYEEVVKLNEQFPVLSDAELEHIRVMMDSGQASEARRLVFEKFYDKMDEGASKMNGAWSNAVDNFKAAFRRFLDWLGSTTVLQNFIKSTNDALVGLNYLLLRARGLSHEQAGQAAVNGAGRAPTAPRPQGRPGGGPTGNQDRGTSAAGQRMIADAERELDVRKRLTKEERLRNAAIDARRKALAGGATAAEAERLAVLAQRKEQNALNDEAAKRGAKAKRSADAAARRAQNEAEALAKRIESQTESLHSSLDRMNAQVARVAMGSLTDQMDNAVKAVDDQFARLYRQLEDFRRLAGPNAKIDGMTQDQYRQQLDTNKAILANQARLGVYEDNLNRLLDQRKNLLADIEEKAQQGSISSDEAVRQAAEVTSRLNPLIADLGVAGARFAQDIGGAAPSPELQAFIAKMDRAVGEARNTGTGSQQAAFGNARIGQEEQKLNQIISERNNLIASYNTLVKLGLMTQEDARQKTADAFRESQPLINNQTAAMRRLIDTLREQGVITAQVYDTWVAKLQAVDAQAQYTDANVLALNNLVQNQLLQGGSAMFDAFAKGLAGLVTGTESVGDAFNNLLDTFLNFAATFLMEIGKMILQALLLQAIQSALGLPGGGGGLGGLIFGSVKHGGGTMGDFSGGHRRRGFALSPAVLSALPRYHEGTQGAGLKNNEMLAVLERGEKVVTEEQQRKEAASKSSNDGATGLRNILAVGDDEIANAMAGSSGERTVMSHLRRNKTALKQMLRD